MNRLIIDFDEPIFNIKELTDENGDTWILDGYCSRCGLCCINPNYNVGFNDETGKCSNLIYETLDGKINYRCKTYTNRPMGCVLWPRSLKDLKDIPECTYKWVKKQ